VLWNRRGNHYRYMTTVQLDGIYRYVYAPCSDFDSLGSISERER